MGQRGRSEVSELDRNLWYLRRCECGDYEGTGYGSNDKNVNAGRIRSQGSSVGCNFWCNCILVFEKGLCSFNHMNWRFGNKIGMAAS